MLEQSFSTWLSKMHSTCPEEHFALKFFNIFFIISGIVTKNSQHCCQNCFSRVWKKALGENKFWGKITVKRILFDFDQKNVRSLVKTALHVSKGTLSQLDWKTYVLLKLFRIFWAKTYGIQRKFFMKNSQNWIVRVQKKVYPGEST